MISEGDQKEGNYSNRYRSDQAMNNDGRGRRSEGHAKAINTAEMKD